MDYALVKLVAHTILKLCEQRDCSVNPIDSTEIYKQLQESGEQMRNYELRDTLRHLESYGCFRCEPGFDGEPAKLHGNMAINSIRLERLKRWAT
jgi:hypothetical protein